MSTEHSPKDPGATPRTDTRVAPARVLLGYDVVRADFARELERELNEAKSHNATLERSNARLRAKLGQWGKR